VHKVDITWLMVVVLVVLARKCILVACLFDLGLLHQNCLCVVLLLVDTLELVFSHLVCHVLKIGHHFLVGLIFFFWGAIVHLL
jgi:hypothetical protein